MNEKSLIKTIILPSIMVGAFVLNRFSLVDTVCANLMLNQAVRGCAIPQEGLLNQLCKKSNGAENPRLVWLRGYSLWSAGYLDQAKSEWRSAPQYSAQMLINQVETKKMDPTERIMVLETILLLDSKSSQTSGIATEYLLGEKQWSTGYHILADIYEREPDNSVIKAALALASFYENPRGYDALSLFDQALDEEPDNIYVLRYGFRLMVKDTDFGIERTRRLATLAQEQHLQDFALSFGVANAFRKLGNYQMALEYNLDALNIYPEHPVANLQQVELLQILADDNPKDPWLDIAFHARSSNPSYLQRLIGVLVNAGQIDRALTVFCEGVSYSVSPTTLTTLVADKWQDLFIKDNCAGYSGNIDTYGEE